MIIARHLVHTLSRTRLCWRLPDMTRDSSTAPASVHGATAIMSTSEVFYSGEGGLAIDKSIST